MAKQSQYAQIITGLATVEPYAYIAKPDFGTEKFRSVHGQYKFSFTIPKSDLRCRTLMDIIDTEYEANLDNLNESLSSQSRQQVRGKKPPRIEEGDKPYFENDDGTVTFKCGCHAGFTDKKTGESKKIFLPVTDGKGVPLKEVPNIGAGSTIKVKLQLVPYGSTAIPASIKLRPIAVMLVNLVEHGANSGVVDWGDEEEENTYKAPVELNSSGDDCAPFDPEEDEANGDF